MKPKLVSAEDNKPEDMPSVEVPSMGAFNESSALYEILSRVEAQRNAAFAELAKEQGRTKEFMDRHQAYVQKSQVAMQTMKEQIEQLKKDLAGSKEKVASLAADLNALSPPLQDKSALKEEQEIVKKPYDEGDLDIEDDSKYEEEDKEEFVAKD